MLTAPARTPVTDFESALTLPGSLISTASVTAFFFTDGPNVKPRPAMVICSSKVAEAAHRDELDIPADYPQFNQSGLKVSSRCRLSRMTTLAMPLIRRRIGSLPPDHRPVCVQILREIVCAAA
jgi:hypothetical protein